MIIALLGITPDLMAQAGNVSVRLNRAETKGNALNLDADVRINKFNIGRYESLSLTLVLKGTGQGQTQSLPPVIVNGANKRQMYERALALRGATAAKNGAYAVLKNDPELIQFLPYKRAVAYKAWMSNCQLVLIGEVKNYRNQTLRTFTNVVVPRLAVQRSGATTPATTGTNAPNRTNTYNMPPQQNNPNVRPPANNPNTRPPNNQARPANTQTRPANTQTRPANTQTQTRPANTQTRPANTQQQTRSTARPATTNTAPRR
jgi:hypothetical protein